MKLDTLTQSDFQSGQKLQTVESILNNLEEENSGHETVMSYCYGGLSEKEQSKLVCLGCRFYQGKVRDNYFHDDSITMITSDRVSAFDCVLGTIPFKGQILTEIANFWFDKTKHIVPNHIIDYPDPQVLITKRAKTLPVEVIIRQYITGSLWREYSDGINGQYGFMLPDGLKKDQLFETPILTPSTKAQYGLHDEPITRKDIINGHVDEEIYAQAESYALKLFEAGQHWASQQGLILVDTKYEFGFR